MLAEEKNERPPRIEERVATRDDDRDGAGEVFQLRHGEVVGQAVGLRKRFFC